jgi:hypothetical protein
MASSSLKRVWQTGGGGHKVMSPVMSILDVCGEVPYFCFSALSPTFLSLVHFFFKKEKGMYVRSLFCICALMTNNIAALKKILPQLRTMFAAQY